MSDEHTQPQQPPPDTPAQQYPPPQYPPPYPPQQQYPPQYGYPPPPYRQAPPANGLAIASLACSIAGIVAIPLIGSILGIIFGSIAKRQIAESQGREGGLGLAQAGVIIGWVGLGFIALVIFVLLLLVIGAFSVSTSIDTSLGLIG